MSTPVANGTDSGDRRHFTFVSLCSFHCSSLLVCLLGFAHCLRGRGRPCSTKKLPLRTFPLPVAPCISVDCLWPSFAFSFCLLPLSFLRIFSLPTTIVFRLWCPFHLEFEAIGSKRGITLSHGYFGRRNHVGYRKGSSPEDEETLNTWFLHLVIR